MSPSARSAATLDRTPARPRVIIALEQLELTRVATGDVVTLPAPRALWLTNEFSGAVRNALDRDQRYVVVLFPDGNYDGEASSEEGHDLLALPWCRVASEKITAAADDVLLRVNAHAAIEDSDQDRAGSDGGVYVLLRGNA